MPGHDIIAIGTSAGGVEALMRLTQRLPDDLPAVVLVVMHVPEHAPSVLPAILERAGALPASHPVDGETPQPGHIYCAPPGAHLLVERGRLRVIAGPRENRHRPAIDPLFRTAALAYGPQVIGVVLTGALNDGTAGLLAIKRRGGLVVVQDPEEALAPSMPTSALAYVDVDRCLPLAGIADYLVAMAHEPVGASDEAEPLEGMVMEGELSGLRPERRMEGKKVGGKLSIYTCPECKGPLWEIRDGKLLRFRCQVGHGFTSDALLDGQAEAVDDALWTALETMEQRANILERLVAHAREQNHVGVATLYEAQLTVMRQKVATLRQALFIGGMREALANEDSAATEEPSAVADDEDVADVADEGSALTP